MHIALYILLMLGGATMVIPFLIMVSGSVEPRSDTRASWIPSYFINREEMWSRYLSSKYQDTSELLRMAYSDPKITFASAARSSTAEADTQLWDHFLAEVKIDPRLQFPGFLRANTRMPSYSGRQFRLWLLGQYGDDLSALNADLGTQFIKRENVQPPRLSLAGPSTPDSPLQRKYGLFLAMLPPDRLLPWNVGGYYRAVFLPTLYGENVSAYNLKNGSNYSSYSAIPFSREAPLIGRDDWSFFVSKVLCPDFVQITEQGEQKRIESGLDRLEFISTSAEAAHLQVVSIDTLYAEWAKAHGIDDARIPQQALDTRAFGREEYFWRWQFLIMNYQRVFDEVLLYGRSVLNTFVLVALSVAGALLVNPLAAYALSRFKMRKTYHILLFCLATIAFPAEVTMIPVFLQMKELHLLNTFGALVLPTVASGFSIFLLKGFFDSLPKELYEAAQLDGASEWSMFWQITMNLSRPILAVIALGAFTSAYGTFFYALILAPDSKMWTLMVYIFQLRSSVDYPVVYASLIITAIPTLLVFIFCQNIILRGIVVPSDK